ncbi:HAD family hydrolase [Egbenema bharatensis]|uniref:HAD family hydrolase n=1 Tax=Egbenema bharatensis TaxID=3463334 RepID=UPI003A898BE5
MAKTAVSSSEQPYPNPCFYRSDAQHRSVQTTVFCDFDGPIVDVSDRYYSTYQQGLSEVKSIYEAEGEILPLVMLSKAQFWQMKQERTPDPEIALRSGLRGQQIERFLQRVRQIVNQPDLLHRDQLQPGVRWALSLLQARGMRLVLVTLRCQQQAESILQHYGLIQFFSEIYGSDNQQAAYFNQADHKTQLLKTAIASWQSSVRFPEAASAWMIGDTEADILAGQATDIPTIALTCGIRSQNYLQRFQPTHIHADLVAATHYLVKTQAIAA